MQLKNILVSTDFSKHSLLAVDFAIDRAEHYGSKIHLLHVIEKIPPILAIRTLDLTEEKVSEIIMSEANENLNRILDNIKSKSNVNVCSAIRKGIDYQEIVNYAKENSIDLIAIASTGKTGILHTLLGSVAEKVIRYATCPVLVIKNKEHD